MCVQWELDVHIDYIGVYSDFLNLKMMCRFSLSKVLIDRKSVV